MGNVFKKVSGDAKGLGGVPGMGMRNAYEYVVDIHDYTGCCITRNIV